MTEKIEIFVNGNKTQTRRSASLKSVLLELNLPSLGFGTAACLNGEVINREKWDETPVSAGDRVDILQAFQGG